jgi:type II secretion system protein N
VKLPVDIEALMARRWVRRTVYTVFYLVCFLLFAYWSFPYDRLRDDIVQRVEHTEGPGGPQPSGWELEIVDLSPSWGTGVKLRGVRLVKLPEGPDDAPVNILVEKLVLRTSVLSMMFGSVYLSFDAVIGTGSVEGSYRSSDERTALVADVTDLDLRAVPFFRAMLGIPLTGVVNGNVDLTVAQEPEDTHGEVALAVQGLVLGDSKAKLRVEGMQDGLTIEKIDAGDLELRMETADGVARVSKLAASGTDATIQGSGNLRLLLPLESSRLDLLLRVAFSDAYRNRNDQTRALFSLMEFNPKVREARAADGAMQWRVTGALGGRIVPGPAGRAVLGMQ